MINTIANQPFQIHLDLLKKQTKNRHIVRIILPFLHFRLTPGIKRCVRSRCACVQCVFVCVFKGARWCFSYRCKTPFEQFLVKTDNFPSRHLYGLVRSFDIFRVFFLFRTARCVFNGHHLKVPNSIFFLQKITKH